MVADPVGPRQAAQRGLHHAWHQLVAQPAM